MITSHRPRLFTTRTLCNLLRSGVALSALTVTLPLAAQPASAPADLTPQERRLVQATEGRFEPALDLLRTAVDMNSGSLHHEGVRAVGNLFAQQFESLGFETEWIDMSEVERGGHLVARRPSRDTNALNVLFIGHLDTVFEPDSPFQRFEFVDEQGTPSDTPTRWGKGPGTTDMKGGNVIMLEVVRALDAVGVGPRVGITAVLIGDEERSGKPLSISRRDLRAAAEGVDFAFGFEDGDGNPATAVISRRGAAGWTLEVTGTPAHSSQIFQPANGAGAIFEAARILNGFYEELSTVPNLTFNPGNILGGTEIDYGAQQAKGSAFGKNNVIAERALVHGDLRVLSPEQYEMAKERMKEIVARHLPGTTASITFDDGYPPMEPSDGNRELLSMLDAASRDLGYGTMEPVNPRNAGAADISFVADLVPAALDGLGLMGTGGHTVNEVADLDTLISQTQRVALAIYRLARR